MMFFNKVRIQFINQLLTNILFQFNKSLFIFSALNRVNIQSEYYYLEIYI